MKIILIRHGDPDYEKDSLTEKGWREAECLADMLCRQDTNDPHCLKNTADTYFYMSPLGRAMNTAKATMERLGRKAEVLPWLREFDAPIWRPDDKTKMRITWDWLPQDWANEAIFYDRDHWHESEYLAPYKVWDEYHWVTSEFDALLAKHGYRREGDLYMAERSNHDTIVLFCHFGCGAVLLSHLMGVSPMVFWHHFCAAPSSVTTLVTEERREGVALFRMSAYGETTHLYVGGEQPAFAARFCECYEDETRHD